MNFPHELQLVCPHAKDRWGKYLEEAEGLISGHRLVDYGPPEENFAMIARLFEEELGVTVSPALAARLMQLVKLARLKKSPHHHDSIVDYAAYRILEERLSEVDRAA